MVAEAMGPLARVVLFLPVGICDLRRTPAWIAELVLSEKRGLRAAAGDRVVLSPKLRQSNGAGYQLPDF